MAAIPRWMQELETPECPPGWRTGPPDFVGVGAYRVQRWVEGSHVELVSNERYVLGRPKIDSIIWRLSTDSSAAHRKGPCR